MAWEWVSPVAAAGGGLLGGGIGAFFTWLTGQQSRDQALTTLRDQLHHDRLQAREAREQERLESAYLELLKMAERTGQWAQMVYPEMQAGPLPDTPIPSLEIQADTAALLAAFGSEDVRELGERWEAVVRQMIRNAELVEFEERNPPMPGDSTDYRWQRPYENSPRWVIHTLRPDEKLARDALGAQVRSELAFGYRSTREPTGATRSYTTPPGRQRPTNQSLPTSQSTTGESPEP